jgi:hypothetical protein
MTVPLFDYTRMSAAQFQWRPRIEPARDCEGFYVLLNEYGWLCGDLRQAISEFAALERIEREGCA